MISIVLILPLTILFISIFVSHDQIYGDANLIINDASLKVTKIATGLDWPSGFEIIDNDILVLEKNSGKVKLIRDDILKKYPLIDLNTSSTNMGTGLLGISSILKDNTRYVFLYNSEEIRTLEDNTSDYGLSNKLLRYVWNASGLKLSDGMVLSEMISSDSSTNNGGKVLVGPDLRLYVTVGDMNNEGKEQNIPEEESFYELFLGSDTKSGAILRLTLDGNPSDNNPFDEKGFETYYAFGIRNSFGIAFDPVTNYLWDTEQGPGMFDEINLVKSGFNSGWRSIQGNSLDNCCTQVGLNLSQNPNKLFNIRGSTYSEPKLVFDNSTFLTDILFLNSTELGSKYTNTMFVGDLSGNIYNFQMSSNRQELVHSNNISEDILLSGLGPISDLKVGPDGYLYILTYANTTRPPYFDDSGSLYLIANNTMNLKNENDFVAIEIWAMLMTFVVIGSVLLTIYKRNYWLRIKGAFLNR
jgi:glucose/arabinose dehydrogenase